MKPVMYCIAKYLQANYTTIRNRHYLPKSNFIKLSQYRSLIELHFLKLHNFNFKFNYQDLWSYRLCRNQVRAKWHLLYISSPELTQQSNANCLEPKNLCSSIVQYSPTVPTVLNSFFFLTNIIKTILHIQMLCISKYSYKCSAYLKISHGRFEHVTLDWKQTRLLLLTSRNFEGRKASRKLN